MLSILTLRTVLRILVKLTGRISTAMFRYLPFIWVFVKIAGTVPEAVIRGSGEANLAIFRVYLGDVAPGE